MAVARLFGRSPDRLYPGDDGLGRRSEDLTQAGDDPVELGVEDGVGRLLAGYARVGRNG